MAKTRKAAASANNAMGSNCAHLRHLERDPQLRQGRERDAPPRVEKRPKGAAGHILGQDDGPGDLHVAEEAEDVGVGEAGHDGGLAKCGLRMEEEDGWEEVTPAHWIKNR